MNIVTCNIKQSGMAGAASWTYFNHMSAPRFMMNMWHLDALWMGVSDPRWDGKQFPFLNKTSWLLRGTSPYQGHLPWAKARKLQLPQSQWCGTLLKGMVKTSHNMSTVLWWKMLCKLGSCLGFADNSQTHDADAHEPRNPTPSVFSSNADDHVLALRWKAPTGQQLANHRSPLTWEVLKLGLLRGPCILTGLKLKLRECPASCAADPT